jgi:hypothetical protein
MAAGAEVLSTYGAQKSGSLPLVAHLLRALVICQSCIERTAHCALRLCN